MKRAGFANDTDEYLFAPDFEDQDRRRIGWAGDTLRCRMPILANEADQLVSKLKPQKKISRVVDHEVVPPKGFAKKLISVSSMFGD